MGKAIPHIAAMAAIPLILAFLAIVASEWDRGKREGFAEGVKATRAEAVEAGVAEWVVKGPNGETEFRWIEPQQAGGEQ